PADVEQPAMEGDGDREAGENEVRRVIEGEAEPVAIAERAIEHDAHRFDRIFPHRQHHDAADDEGQRHVEDRQQDDIDPAGQGHGRAHGLASAGDFPSAFMPAIRRPSSPSSAVAGSASPTIWPSNRTTMRSESERISSSSTETSRMALPASRILMIWLWMNSMAPISAPRVGWPTRSTDRSRSISRASTIFCWLPPEKLAVLRSASAGR